MPLYMSTFGYKPEVWADLIKSPGDREGDSPRDPRAGWLQAARALVCLRQKVKQFALNEAAGSAPERAESRSGWPQTGVLEQSSRTTVVRCRFDDMLTTGVEELRTAW